MEAACSMPLERSNSPHSYAQARTNVVMETVRAATMATTKKLERLALLQDQYKKKAEMVSKSAEQGLNMLVEKKPSVVDKKKSNGSEAISVFSSSSSSMNDLSSVATSNSQFIPKGASSPIMSHKKTRGYHDDFKKYKAPFMAPEKLQIVKPLEGKFVIFMILIVSCTIMTIAPDNLNIILCVYNNPAINHEISILKVMLFSYTFLCER